MDDEVCRSCGQKKHKYPGRLGERRVKRPYPRTGATLFCQGSEAEYQSKCQAYMDQKYDAEFELLTELMAHYGLDPTNAAAWILLSLMLARAHVPGFQTRKAPGRPSPFQPDICLFWVRVQRRMESHLESERAACHALALADRNNKGRSYQDRFQRAKRNPLIRVMVEARKMAPRAASLDELEKLFRKLM